VNGVEGDSRLGTLRAVSGDGFFYLNTHSGMAKRKDGSQQFMMASSTQKTTQTETIPEIKDDWDHFRIGYMSLVRASRTG